MSAVLFMFNTSRKGLEAREAEFIRPKRLINNRIPLKRDKLKLISLPSALGSVIQDNDGYDFKTSIPYDIMLALAEEVLASTQQGLTQTKVFDLASRMDTFRSEPTGQNALMLAVSRGEDAFSEYIHNHLDQP